MIPESARVHPISAVSILISPFQFQHNYVQSKMIRWAVEVVAVVVAELVMVVVAIVVVMAIVVLMAIVVFRRLCRLQVVILISNEVFCSTHSVAKP